MEKEAIPVFVVLYTENHPDREIILIGVYSTEELAKKAIEQDMAVTKQAMPNAYISKYDYRIISEQLDQS